MRPIVRSRALTTLSIVAFIGLVTFLCAFKVDDLDVWYHMKLRVETQGDRGTVQGKVWKKDETEPAEWTITLEDPLPVLSGAPGIYGDSATALYYDNVTVRANE